MDHRNTHESGKAELLDFEIVQESRQAVWTPSPWQTVRFVLLGMTGLAFFIAFLLLGVIIVIPLLIFMVLTRVIASLFSPAPER